MVSRNCLFLWQDKQEGAWPMAGQHHITPAVKGGKIGSWTSSFTLYLILRHSLPPRGWKFPGFLCTGGSKHGDKESENKTACWVVAENISWTSVSKHPDHLAALKYLSPAPKTFFSLMTKARQMQDIPQSRGTAHLNFNFTSTFSFQLLLCQLHQRTLGHWMGCQSWKLLSSPLGYTGNLTCTLLPEITHKLEPRVLSWRQVLPGGVLPGN